MPLPPRGYGGVSRTAFSALAPLTLRFAHGSYRWRGGDIALFRTPLTFFFFQSSSPRRLSYQRMEFPPPRVYGRVSTKAYSALALLRLHFAFGFDR